VYVNPMRLLSCCGVMVYVFTHCSAIKEHSEIELVAGMTKTMVQTSDSRSLCAVVKELKYIRFYT